MPRAAALTLALPLAAQAPPALPALQAVTVGEISTLALPMRVELGAYLPQIEALAPRTPPVVEQWAEIPNKPRTYFRCNLYREPLAFRFTNQRVAVTTVVNFGMDVGVRTVGEHYTTVGSCGRAPEPPRRAMIEVDTQWALRPDWRLELRDPIATATALNACQITFLGIDITEDVTQGMQGQVKTAVAQLDDLVRKNDLLRQRAQEAWAMATQPFELRKDVWLVLRPEKLRMGPIRTEGQTLFVTPELQARPLIIVGPKPPAEPRPLPDLDVASEILPGFRVRAEAELDYASATLQLNETLAGKAFDTERGPLTINTAALAGADGKAILELDVKGPVTGIITLQGRPIITPEGLVQFENLDFTLASTGWLTRTAAWLFKSKIRKMIQDQSTVLIGQQFKELMALAHQQLNRTLAPGLEMKGQLKEVRLQSVLAAPTAFRVVAWIEGEAEVVAR
ncbi:MAG TPA: DUF4403 family protein [Holophagaceae bacterium]|nr:DUF4403 family protein [Holophagaceae bacterium]